MEWLKDALLARKAHELAEQWQSVAQALGRLVQNDQALRAVPPSAAWTVLLALQGSLGHLEEAVRAARRHELPPEARRALSELAYALSGLSDVVDRYGLPAAEKMYGGPPSHPS